MKVLVGAEKKKRRRRMGVGIWVAKPPPEPDAWLFFFLLLNVGVTRLTVAEKLGSWCVFLRPPLFSFQPGLGRMRDAVVTAE